MTGSSLSFVRGHECPCCRGFRRRGELGARPDEILGMLERAELTRVVADVGLGDSPGLWLTWRVTIRTTSH